MRPAPVTIMLYTLLVHTMALADDPAPSPATVPPVILEMGADGVQHLTMTLDSYSFKPAHVIVKAGTPVEITLNNVSTVAPHSFVIDDPDLQVKQDVESGKSGVVKFTAAKAGTYAFFCDHKLLMFPSHRSKGMEGVLEVR
ncbi:MAG TPA: cupredoxin domain-containing protein [Gammaproteobacteria bacterium]|nr:cupredoxin domain-containing protein [Gammaproteobacteria bacterium]